MIIIRSGIAVFKGVEASDEGPITKCPECAFTNAVEQCDHIYDFKTRVELLEVECDQCGCIYRLERKQDHDAE